MSAIEVLVVIVFAYLGYLISSVLISKKTKPDGADSNPHANSTSSSESQSNYSQGYQQESRAHENDDISSSWFRILEVPKTASLEIIASAYKRKISQYHPDKVANLGSELRELAELKSKQINSAYDYAKKLKN
jgi:DnaJ-domain-containing protein 1